MSGEGNNKTCHHYAHHRHQFDEDVERRTACVLKWIANCITDYCGLMTLRTLASEVAFLYHLLCIVPCSTGICHKHGKSESGCQSTDKQSHNTSHTKLQSDNNGNGDGKKTREYHLLLS